MFMKRGIGLKNLLRGRLGNILRFSLVTREAGFNTVRHTKQREELEKLGFECDMHEYVGKGRDDLQRFIDEKLGDVVLWQISDYLDVSDYEFLAEKMKAARKILLNGNFFAKRLLKYNQQELMLDAGNGDLCIKTKRILANEDVVNAIEGLKLKYPVVIKPDFGSIGNGVMVVDSEYEIRPRVFNEDVVVQEFIENDGDWRVFMVEDEFLGGMKRKAKDGGRINNFSFGSEITKEDDPETLRELEEIGQRAIEAHGYLWGGVDVIRDKKTGKFYFLELNPFPQWTGFAQVFPEHNIPELIARAIKKEYDEKNGT